MFGLVSSKSEALTSKAEEVKKGEDVSAMIDIMWGVMTQGRGIGLAANQIGDLKRVIVVHVDGFRQEFINPKLTRKYGGTVTKKEGCLSYPGKTALKVRAKRVEIEGFDRSWKPVKFKLKGMRAVCVQHEVDHLDGITIATK